MGLSPMLDAFIEKTMTERHIPGLAIAIQQRGKMLHEGYYGLANLEHQVPVSKQTVFEIASVTKVFTAQAILRLIQDGQIKLDDPLTKYVDNLPASWHAITVENCLRHQSGIPNYTAQDRYWELQRVDKSPQQVLDLVRDLPLNFAPGSRY